MSSTHNPGRVAGFPYLLLVVFAPIRLIYIPSKLFVHGNATATASEIAAHELLFRLGIVSDLFCCSQLMSLPAAGVEWAHSPTHSSRYFRSIYVLGKLPYNAQTGHYR